MTGQIIVARDGHVATVTIDNPTKSGLTIPVIAMNG